MPPAILPSVVMVPAVCRCLMVAPLMYLNGAIHASPPLLCVRFSVSVWPPPSKVPLKLLVLLEPAPVVMVMSAVSVTVWPLYVVPLLTFVAKVFHSSAELMVTCAQAVLPMVKSAARITVILSPFVILSEAKNLCCFMAFTV